MAVNITEELVWDAQDMIQVLGRKVDWLVSKLGGDPEVIGRGPDRRTPPEGFRAV